jgi:lysophospholipid acyltransferase (LPLAT)-like uncharacterized protein
MRDHLFMLKAFIRSAPMQWFLATIIAAYMQLVRSTTRWETIGLEHVKPVWASGKGVVWCYWHSRLMGAHAIWPIDVQEVLMIISLSADGGFVTKATEMIGRKVVRGSSTKAGSAHNKGALAAFRAMVAHAKAKGCVGITPDGPRGPRMRVQDGAVRVAKASGAVLVPSAYAIAGSTYAKSWDRLVLPPIFGRGVKVFGRAIEVPRDADDAALEAIRLDLEGELNRALWLADAHVGGPRIEPAPAVESPPT